MSTQRKAVLLQGTLDLLIQWTLVLGKQQGQGVARSIHQASERALLVEHGSLYPALQRLEKKSWIKAQWGASEKNRRARFDELTAAGRKQLVNETKEWRRLVGAVGRILSPEAAGI